MKSFTLKAHQAAVVGDYVRGCISVTDLVLWLMSEGIHISTLSANTMTLCQVAEDEPDEAGILPPVNLDDTAWCTVLLT
jgi:hypothetical protein